MWVIPVDVLKSLLQVDKKKIAEASHVLARAFQDDPLTEHFFPNPATRKELSPAFYEFRLRLASRFGTIYTTSPNMEGIATWLPSNRGKSSMWHMIRAGGFGLGRKVGNDTISMMNAVNEFVTYMREKNAGDKYLHLEMLAVDPKYQRMGFAKKLLSPMFEQLDSERLHCYLETTAEKNVSFYQYFGFEVVDESAIPGSGVQIWDMIRKPP